MFFKSVFAFLMCAVALTGCQTVKSAWSNRDDGSLAYTHAQKLPPLNLPAAQQTAPFTPIYAVPEGGQPIEQSGKQFTLPTPPQAVR